MKKIRIRTMNKNLVEELKNDIVNEKVSLATALRKAKLLAFELQSDEFRKWVDSELSGYRREVELPEYRRIHAQNLGNFSGPFGAGIKNMMLPTYNLPDSIKEFADKLVFSEGIKELESLANAGKNLQRKWPAEAIILAREHIPISGGYVLVDAWQPIAYQSVVGILDAVRNRLLDLLLDLQSTFPQIVQSSESLSDISKEEVSQIFNLNIYGNHAVVAAGDNFTQQVKVDVVQNDIETLFQYFRTLNISEQDLDELNNSIKKDGKRENKKFGDKVKEWRGKMLGKASEGIWNITIQTAAALLTSALQKYYGF
jgi:hypothetical protein